MAASDYGHTSVTLTTGEKVLQVLWVIFGMQPNGNLAGNYKEAFVLNVLLMIPLGYLVILHFLCGDTKTAGFSDSSVSHVNGKAGTKESEKRTLSKPALKTEMICIATSLIIEMTQELTTLGMFDINDILANTIGSCIGIGMVCFGQHFRRSKCREVA